MIPSLVSGGRRTTGIIFHKLVTSVTCLQACQSDRGITLVSGAVSQWNDQTVSGLNYTQGTAAARPTFNQTALNGRPTLTFDGSNDLLDSSLILAAPGTTPTFIWAVLKTITWTINESIFATSGAEVSIRVSHRTATPQISQASPTIVNNNGGAAVGKWVRMEAWFNNATSDYLKLASTSVTGANAGNTAGVTGRTIGTAAAATFSNVELAAVLYFSGKPSTAELALLTSAVIAIYGASVGV